MQMYNPPHVGELYIVFSVSVSDSEVESNIQPIRGIEEAPGVESF